MSNVTKSTDYEVYHVRGGQGGYEWATICWKGWQATGNDGTPRECGEILIHSSFGSWANSWGHLGIPFDKWLTKAELSYCAEKFMSSKAYVFDGEKTVKELRNSLLESRRSGDVTKLDARAIWDFIEDHDDEMESSSDLFCERMFDCVRLADWPPCNGRYSDAKPERGARHFLEEPWERIATSLDHQFAGFWRDIMPVFQQALREEIAQASTAEMAAA